MATDLSARFRKLGTATTTWPMYYQHGLRNVVMQGLHSIGPAQPIAGPARTVRCLPIREDLEKFPRGSPNRDVMDDVKPGEVVVIDGLGVLNGAIVGDNHALRVKLLGGAGVVVDGAIRDADAIQRLGGVPFYARGTYPQPFIWVMAAWERDIPIQCGGVYVEPGDYIVGDGDGVIVVPKALAEKVAAKAEDKMLEEAFGMGLQRAGSKLIDAYPLPESRRQEFEEFKRKNAL